MAAAARRSQIIGTGAYLPSRVVTNEELAHRVAAASRQPRLTTRLTPADILKRTGIVERRYAAADEATSDLAAHAGRAALDNARVAPTSVDLIICSTTSPDMVFPATACLVQRRLGMKRVGAFDVAASCTGFLYALAIADRYLRTGEANTVLVVASEVKSRVLDDRDPGTAILFGDGAGAVVLTTGPRRVAAHSPHRGVLSIRLHSDGRHGHLIQVPGGGSRHPLTRESLENRLHHIRMQGTALYRAAVRHMEAAITEALVAHRLTVESPRLYILHQANRRILEAVIRRLGLPRERVALTIDRYGNTSSATIPIALDAAARAGRLTRGDLVLLVGFGGGLTWGSCLIRW